MYVIETDLGRFEGETEKDAKKLLRKAQREAKKQHDIARANSIQATLKAKANGFDILSRYVEGKKLSHPWVIRKGDKGFTSYVRVNEENHRQSWVRTHECHLATEISLYAYECVAIALALDGSVVAIWTEDMDRRSEVTPMAVGVHEKSYCIEYLPEQITPEWYESTEEHHFA